MHADILFRGGTVVPDHRSGDRADALAISGGRVIALGSEALTADAAEVVDLRGGTLVPAFGDGHAHPMWGGVEMGQAPIRDCTSVAEVVEAVRRYAADSPDLPWVLGGSYDPSLAPGGLFDARWLDEAVADRPVVLQSADHHAAWVNTVALDLAGIGAGTVDPPAGTIARRPDGTPLGTLVEWTAMDLVLEHVPPTTMAQKVEGLDRSTTALAAAGVTWVQEAALAPEDVEAYRRAAAGGRLHVRANIALRAEPDRWQAQQPTFVAARASLAGDPQLSARTVKFFADGVIELGTAALLEPYVDAPHSCGLPVWDPTELAAAATAFDADGFQLHIHAIGDAGIRAALDAIEQAVRQNGPRDRRPVITHVQLVHPDDVPRFAALGVIANAQPLWACPDACQTDLTVPRIGPERSRWQYPFAGLLRSGARLSTGSDWPVSSLRPLECLATAVTRTTPDGEPPGGWLPEQRLTPGEALSAATAGVAHQAFDEADGGVLAVGRRADVVWLEADPHAVPAERWSDLEVRGTWRDGVRTC